MLLRGGPSCVTRVEHADRKQASPVVFPNESFPSMAIDMVILNQIKRQYNVEQNGNPK